MSCHTPIPNFEFAREEIEDAVRNGRLLSMEIEPSLRCNFHCPYCYIPENSSLENELTVEEICDVILQAQDLGAKKIIILGGEPMIYPHIMEIIKFIRTHHLNVEMFTNGSNITADIAKQLFDYGVNVVLKMNTLNEHTQDILAGKKGSFKIIQEAFHNLKQARRPSGETFLAISTVICSQNIDELVDMWQKLRDQNIIPYFEMITPQGNIRQNGWLNIEPQKLHDIFCKIAEIDRTHYGYFWEPQPPLIGNRCLRHQFSCLVTSQGYVTPCVGVTIPVGSIRKQKLRDIIKDSEVIQDLRNYHDTMKAPCRECEKSNECYGCRGAAYQLTGDYLASDPMCWKNVDKQGEIARLPIAVEELIPQKSPMRVIDTLVKVGERSADVTVTLSKDMLFIDESGLLDEAAYLEMIAQAIASLSGFKHMGASKPAPGGFLLGAKKLEILGKAHVGDTLNISFYKYARYGGFGIVKGTVSRDNHVLARGEVKIWHEI
ncbi:MAG: radical SAM protein [bacterium]|nr:radical SAM protein [bacterium]